MVDHPERVRVDYEIIDGQIAMNLRVDPSDLGKVIGRYGRTARSLRTILGAASMKAQQHFSLEISAMDPVEPPNT